MIRNTVSIVPALILIALFPCTRSSMVAQSELLSREDQQGLVKEILGQIEKIYPFPEIAQRMTHGVMDSLQAGTYTRYTTPAEFAQRLSADLGTLSNDSHVGLTFDPPRAAEMRKWEKEGLEDPFAASTREVERWNNYGFKELRILDGNVGYLDLRTFFAVKYAGATAVAAMGYLSNCSALIIDLRNNGGGWDDMVTFLASYFFDTDAGIVFGIKMSTKDSTFYSSMTSAYVPGKLLADIPVYILVSGRTASGAEAFASIMKNVRKNTVLVGERTAGAENPQESVIIRDRYILWVPGWKTIFSRANLSWEGAGVEPEVTVSAESALGVAHLRALNVLLEKAADKAIKERYQWALDGVRATSSTLKIEAALQRGYAGHFGNRTITLQGDDLYYQYKNRPTRKMIAISKEYFLVEGYDWFRIRFLNENGRLVGFNEVRMDGSVVRCAKE